MRRALTFLFLLTLACASSKSARPATIAQPDIDARLVHQVFFGSGTSAPATIEVRVLNRATVPVMVNRVEIDSPGMGQYTIGRTMRDFKQVVQPGETKALTVFATAYAQTTVNPSEPLMLRAIVEFSAGDAVWREIVMSRE